jgi:hypothetical protein
MLIYKYMFNNMLKTNNICNLIRIFDEIGKWGDNPEVRK